MNKTKIIRYLIENKNKDLNISNISKAVSLDYKNTYTIIKKLEKENTIKITRFGNSNKITLNSSLNKDILLAEYEKKQSILKNKDLKVSLNTIKRKLKYKLYIVLLFGSYAKDKQKPGSDIDLIIICPNNRQDDIEKNMDKITDTLPLPLHILVFSEDEYKEMLQSKEPNVAKEAQNDRIILYNIESYYELL